MKVKKRLVYGVLSACIMLGIFFLHEIGDERIHAGGDVAVPTFSKESGFYGEGFTLTLEARPGHRIYYTTDGSVPLSKEEEALKPTPTPIPQEDLLADGRFDISVANTYFIRDVTATEVSDGTKLEFDSRYNSICFNAPDGITDWSNYTDVVIEYSVNVSRNGNGVGLQACPIFADAWDSWGYDGEVRSFEARTSAAPNSGRQTWEIGLEGKNVSDIGWLMIGVTNENADTGKKDTITIHSITLKADSAPKHPNPKLDTVEYKEGFPVKDRSNDTNVLSARENVKLMSSSGYCAFYVPSNNQVPKATVIRAIAVDEQGNKSNVATKTYFVGNHFNDGVPILSVVTDPNNLLNEEIGIYRVGNYMNKGVEWERPAFVELFEEDGEIPFSTEMGIRIHGNYSRHFMQKSFNFYFREEYGLKNLQGYELIPGATNFDKTKKTTKYKNFMLRNGGNDTEYTKLQDVYIQSLVKDRAFTTQSSRPCILYLNGEYWGPYNLTEKYSDNYLEQEFGVNKDNVVVIKDGELDEGLKQDYALYEELLGMAKLDMTIPKNYERFCQMVDVQSYIDFYAVGIYIGNYDWPHRNTQLWRTRTLESRNPYADTKWRWMLYDTEYSMNLYGHSTGNPIRWARANDELFAAVSQNQAFRERFTTVICDLMNSNFKASECETSPSEAIQSLQRFASAYKPLMTKYFNRFGYSYSQTSLATSFDAQVNRIKDFINNRRMAVLNSLKTDFMVKGGHTKLTLKSEVADEMEINTTSAKLRNKEWTGTYFNLYDIEVTAPVVEGYEFAGWKASGLSVTSLTDRKTVARVTSGGDLPVLEAVYVNENLPSTETPAPSPTLPPTRTPSQTPSPTVAPTREPTPSSTPTVTPSPSNNKGIVLKATILSIKSNKKRTVTLRVKKISGVKGYEVRYALNKQFKKAKKLNLTKHEIVSIPKLKSKKKYYVKVRAYKLDAKGKKQFGKYSKFKSVTVR